jgi:hypothetical protein
MWDWLTKKWPLMLKDTHKAEVNRRLATQASGHRREVARLEADIEERIKPLVEKFQRTRVERTGYQFDRYAVRVDLDVWWVEKCLCHGNSQKEIEYLCEIMGRQVSYELGLALRARNFERRDTG